ncbi:hypothetical protein [Frigoribacterium faeni]|nr:hypothetical protein [Frigoribacterium faeni]MBA8814080.1 hypothetical protein [Frigoribacterium faeni]
MTRLPTAASAIALTALLVGGVLTPSAQAATPTPLPFVSALAFRTTGGDYIAYRESPEADTAGRHAFRATRHANAADALATATRVTLPDPGASAAPVSLPTGDGCLAPLPTESEPTLIASPEACTDPSATWRVTRDGLLRQSDDGAVRLGGVQAADPAVWPGTGLRPSLAGGGAPLADQRFDRRSIDARIAQVNDIARTAVVVGTATPYAVIRIGGITADVRGNGTFQLTATRLAPGSNSVHVEQIVAGDLFDATTLVADVVDGGRITAVAGDTVDLERGGDTAVLFGVGIRDAFARLEGTAEVTAPEGTRIAPGQRVLSADRRSAGGTWAADPGLDLTDGTFSTDGRRASFELSWSDDTTSLPRGGEVRWSVAVSTPASVGFGVSGTGTPSDFRAVGSTPVTITVPPREVTAEVTVPRELGPRATVSGGGHDGAAIEVSTEGRTLGSTRVVDEAWSLEIDPAIGPGRHALDVTQSVDGAPAGAARVEVDLGAAVDLLTPATGQVPPGLTTVSGTGADGAEVTVATDDTTVVVPVADGTWSAEVELAPGHAETAVVVSQRARGDVRSSDEVRVVPDARQEIAPVAIGGPADGWYRENVVTSLSGSATPYARVVVRNQWGNEAGRASADALGRWSIDRTWGPTAVYRLTATQTLVDGRGSVSAEFTLLPLGSFRPLAVTSHAARDTYVPGTTIFRGRATPGAWVTATNQWDRRLFATRASQTTGDWSAPAELGPVADYTVRVAQTAPDGQPDQIRIALSPVIGWVPTTVTSHIDGGEYVPGPVTLEGAGTPRASIVITNQWGGSMGRTTVGSDGRWSVRRDMGPRADYALTVTQTRGGDGDTIRLGLRAPAWRQLQLISPEVGDRYRPYEPTEFRGVATPHTEVVATTDLGAELFRTRVTADGSWSTVRAYGPVRTYAITLTQAATTGQGDDVRFVWAPDIPLAPIEVTTHRDGDTYRPGPLVLGGTATAGANITVTNQWGGAMGTAEVGVDGRWAVQRDYGPRSDYALTIVQERAGETDRTTLTLKAPVWRGLEIVSPAPGEGYDRDADTTFSGRATPFATIEVVTTSGTRIATPVADADGDWTFSRRFGPEHVYSLEFTQKAAGFDAETLPVFRFGPAEAVGHPRASTDER